MGLPTYARVPMWLRGAPRDHQSTTGFHVANTFHSLACNDRGNGGGAVRLEGPRPHHRRGECAFLGWSQVSEPDPQHASLRHNEPERGSVGNLNAGGSAAQ